MYSVERSRIPSLSTRACIAVKPNARGAEKWQIPTSQWIRMFVVKRLGKIASDWLEPQWSDD